MQGSVCLTKKDVRVAASSVPYLEERVKTLTESLDMKDATIAEMRRLHGQGIDSGQSELLQK
eukprot:2635146-Rhodomonas_salina.1